MTTAKRVPVAGGLFAETPEGPRLLGSMCTTCGTPYFPKPAVCRNPDCRATSLEDGLRVVGRVTDEASSLRVGAPVELVLAPLRHEDDGGELITWMFRLR